MIQDCHRLVLACRSIYPNKYFGSIRRKYRFYLDDQPGTTDAPGTIILPTEGEDTRVIKILFYTGT